MLLATREGASITQPLVVPIKLGGSATPGADYVKPRREHHLSGPDAAGDGENYSRGRCPRRGHRDGDRHARSGGRTYTLGSEKVRHSDNHRRLRLGRSRSAAGSQGAPPRTPTGTLTVEVTLDGDGNWKSPYKDGAYSAMNFHRMMKYTMPLQGYIAGGSGFTDIDRREQKSQPMLPNLQRYVVLQPQTAMTASSAFRAPRATLQILDEYKGMEVGDPGQPPLVPYTETWRGGGAFPSGDKTVPERDLVPDAISRWTPTSTSFTS